MDELTKLVVAAIGALAAAGIVITITVKIVRNSHKSKKSVKLKQGGVTLREINNSATIDQSDKK